MLGTYTGHLLNPTQILLRKQKLKKVSNLLSTTGMYASRREGLKKKKEEEKDYIGSAHFPNSSTQHSGEKAVIAYCR